IREDGSLELGSHVQEPLAGIAREALKAEAEKRISIAGIRAKLNPASAPAVTAKEPEKLAQKQPEKTTPKVAPVQVPLSPVAPPTMRESRPPVPVRRPEATRAVGQKKSYWMPIGAALVVRSEERRVGKEER